MVFRRQEEREMVLLTFKLSIAVKQLADSCFELEKSLSVTQCGSQLE
jgi:hypothetical protein